MKKLLLIPLLFLSLIALCQPASVKTRPPKDSSVFIANTQYVDLAIRAATNVITVSDSGLFKPYVTDAQGNPFRFAYWPAGFADPLTTNGDIVARVSGVTTRKAKGPDGTYLGVRSGTLDYYAPSDAELSTTNITTNNATASKHGFLPILSNVATQYLDGTGAWSTPPGGSLSASTAPNTSNYTVPSGRRIFVKLSDLTGQANRNVVLPGSPTSGDEAIFRNINTSASTFVWTFTVGTVNDWAGNSITTLANVTTYHLVFDGTNWDIIN